MPQPFRFVHASDLRLDRPLGGLAEVPQHLADLFRDAPYQAAGRVFELAIAERADFLVLAGNVLHVGRAGPRALDFLLDRFGRLAERGIAVYWTSGRAERAGPWPADLPLPANVHLFSRGEPRYCTHQADGESLATLVGAGTGTRNGSPPYDKFARPKGGPFTIAVAEGIVHRGRLSKSTVDYWALGGSQRRRLLRVERRTAVHSGTPQGRSPAQAGVRGAVVVDVDQQGVARPRFVPTDGVRYKRVRVELDVAGPPAEARRVLADRVAAEHARAAGIDLVLDWSIAPATPLARAPEREGMAAQWLRWLREEFGSRSPAAWSGTVTIEAPRAKRPPEDGSLLADYLAAIREFATGDARLPWDVLVPEAERHGPAATLLTPGDNRGQARVLERAAVLGRDLLGAEGVPG